MNFASWAQVQIEWAKCLGGSDAESAQEIHQTADGGYIVAGYSKSIDGQVTVNHGNYDFWVVKLDPLGNITWQKSYGGSDDDRAYSVVQTADGGYVVVGYTKSTDGDVTANLGWYNAWVIKLDGSGNLIWQICYGGTGAEKAYSVQQTFDMGFIVAGNKISQPGTGNVTCMIGMEDCWIIKIDSIGVLNWQTCLGGQYTDQANMIVQTPDSGYVMVGSGSYPSDSGTLLTARLDQFGNILWQNGLGGTMWDLDVGESIKPTSDGGYIVTGVTESNDNDVSGNNGMGDVWVIKLDSLGSAIWQRCLGGSEWDFGSDVHEVNNGYIITGYTKSNDSLVSGNHNSPSWYDYWIVKIDLAGNFMWQKCLGGSLSQECYSSQLTSDGGFILAGSTIGSGGDVTGFKGAMDMWIVKLTERTCTITGNTFLDLNSNSIKDSNEVAMNNQIINETNSGALTFTHPDGNYILSLSDTGNATVIPSNLNYYSAAPVSHAVYFNAFLQMDSLNDFAFQPTGIYNDVCVEITPTSNFRSGMNASYQINYFNVGTTTLTPDVVFYPDPNVQFISAFPLPTIVSTDSVVWSIGTLAPFQHGQISISVFVNTGLLTGSLVNSSALILPVAGDANTFCNLSYWEVFITASVDPNDIIVNRDTVYTWEMISPPYLDYLIRFQNTGNDTAFTVNIVNTISNSLDLSTFEFISASHPVTTTLDFPLRTFEFTFNDILLPDSNVNEPLSHGFIRYRIKPVSTLVVGDSAVNNARIYFDFNDPVYTNDAITRVVLTTSISETESASLKIFPNPATNKLHVQFENTPGNEVEMEIYSIVGRKANCKQQLVNSDQSNEIIFDTSLLPRGIYFVKPTQNNFKAVRFVKM